MKTSKVLIPALTVALVLFVALLTALPSGPAAAAPAAAPTPVTVSQSQKEGHEEALFSSVAITEDTNSTAVNVKQYQITDIQYVIDQTAVNTVTLKLQFSNDNAHWTDGATLVSANVADADALSQQAVFGKYARVNADVTTADLVTVTVLAVLK